MKIAFLLCRFTGYRIKNRVGSGRIPGIYSPDRVRYLSSKNRIGSDTYSKKTGSGRISPVYPVFFDPVGALDGQFPITPNQSKLDKHEWSTQLSLSLAWAIKHKPWEQKESSLCISLSFHFEG
jgi:hypothetical protein